MIPETDNNQIDNQNIVRPPVPVHNRPPPRGPPGPRGGPQNRRPPPPVRSNIPVKQPPNRNVN